MLVDVQRRVAALAAATSKHGHHTHVSAEAVAATVAVVVPAVGLLIWLRRRPARIAPELRPVLQEMFNILDGVTAGLTPHGGELLAARARELDHLRPRVIDYKLKQHLGDISYAAPRAARIPDTVATVRRTLQSPAVESGNEGIREIIDQTVRLTLTDLMQQGAAAVEAAAALRKALDRLTRLERRLL